MLTDFTIMLCCDVNMTRGDLFHSLCLGHACVLMGLDGIRVSVGTQLCQECDQPIVTYELQIKISRKS